MHDVEGPRPGDIEPSAAHVQQLIDFVESWDRADPLLIHCHAGISRSTAAAFVALCALNPGACEMAIAVRLRDASPKAWPNRLLVNHADRLLKRRGRMIRAIDHIGPGLLVGASQSFGLPVRLD